jgi:hypothetical protein
MDIADTGDGIPVAVIEALAAGKPVSSSKREEAAVSAFCVCVAFSVAPAETLSSCLKRVGLA